MEVQTKGSVLLVEDHQDIAELVYDYMEDVGYELDYAPDGEVGINLVAQNDYDAIILDLMLPRRDGLSMCRELREKNGEDDTRIDAHRTGYVGGQTQGV